MTKRHAKPTALQLAERSYRHALSFKSTLLNQMAHIRLDISQARREDREHIVKLIDHCARLLREKETLQKMLAAKPAAHEAFLTGTCAYADSHRINHRCQHCGHLEIASANYDPMYVTPKPWKHTVECNTNNCLRFGRGELPKCICGAPT